MAKRQAQKWKDWFDEVQHRLLAYARSWAPSQADAEDLVQEAIARLWALQRDRGGLPPDLPLAFSTIRFCGLSRYRSEKRRHRRERSILYLNDHDDVWLDPALEDDEEAHLLRRAVEALSPKLREVITLKIWGSLTFAEIAETLAISPNTAASRYRYALEQLAPSVRPIMEVRRAEG